MMKWRKSGNRIAASCWVRSQGVMNGRLSGSCSSESTNSRSLDIVGRRRTRTVERPGELSREVAAVIERLAFPASDVDFHSVPMQLHQLPSGSGFALAHQLGDEVLRLQEVHLAQLDRQQAARVRIERGIPQLLRAHLAQALEAADAPGAFAHTFLAQLVQDGGQFALVECIGLGGGLLA